ncbi:hypothetical protein EON83_19710 [bacterium]|nr:MAG: hypothetical protein EON83_19710 [bacterium]
MIPLWMQSLLQFMLWFAIASIGGCFSYWALRLSPSRIREIFGKLTLLVSAIFLLVQPVIILVLALFAIIPSIAAAFCEKAMDEDGGAWSAHFGLSLLTYLLSIASSLAVFTLISQYGSRPLLFAMGDPKVLWGIFLGLLLTPASISLLRWIIHNSRTRPGIDRHLRNGENTNL